jgi:hypothetical protein
VEPLHNLAGVPPIFYVLDKLKHSYSLKLQGTALNAKTQTILYHNQCHYWPEYVHPYTNLSLSFLKPVESMYWPLSLNNTGLWGKPRFTYLPSPPPHILVTYKHCFMDRNYHTLHIMISPFTHNSLSLAIYQCSLRRHTIYEGCKKGIDYTQAIC